MELWHRPFARSEPSLVLFGPCEWANRLRSLLGRENMETVDLLILRMGKTPSWQRRQSPPVRLFMGWDEGRDAAEL